MIRSLRWNSVLLLLCMAAQLPAEEHTMLAADSVQTDQQLEEVVIAGQQHAHLRSQSDILNKQTISDKELKRAACCNLSEAFETTAAVDVSYADAASGAKQIRLLGLSSSYVQLLNENVPLLRGLAQNRLSYIPGPWMQSIQVSKGTSSVINGYESTTGQINIEYLKPQTQDPLAVNVMLNSELHTEVNLTGGWDVGKYAHTGVLAHYQNGSYGMDHNDDSFLDMPLNQQANLLNRWDIFKGAYTGRVLLRGLWEQRLGGQRVPTGCDCEYIDPYLIDLSTWRIDGFMKNGIMLNADKGMSIGIITAGSYQHQDNQYGSTMWKARQLNLYLNMLFQTDLGERHKLTAGMSVNHDNYAETLQISKHNFELFILDSPQPTSVAPMYADLSRRQTDIGVFAEYAYKYDEKLSLIAGVRGDYTMRQWFENKKNRNQWLVTPRLNIRYAPWEWWVLRASVGLGHRAPNALTDNAPYLVSGRQWSGLQHDWNMETALNTGGSMTFTIPMGKREMQLTAEYYYTHFFDCLLTDIENGGVTLLQLKDLDNGKAYAHTLQVELQAEVLRGWTWSLAYRLTDSRATYGGQLLERPLQNKYKALISTSYLTHLKKWQFDLTLQINGHGRMPQGFDYTGLSQYYVKDGQVWHQWYPQLMGQITRYWRTCSLYLGAENITNFKQKKPIVGHPFTDSFDAAMVWGPITGIKAYIGFRWNLERKEY